MEEVEKEEKVLEEEKEGEEEEGQGEEEESTSSPRETSGLRSESFFRPCDLGIASSVQPCRLGSPAHDSALSAAACSYITGGHRTVGGVMIEEGAEHSSL